MERIVPCSKVLPPPDLGKSVCVSAGIQNIRYSDKQSFRKEVIRMPQPVIVRLPNQMSVLLRALEFHTHWDGVYRTLGHPLSQTLGQSVTAPSELSFGAFLLEERRTTAYGQRRLFHGSPGRSPY